MAPQKSSQIAIGGVFSALCLLLMFMSSIIPFSSFALPMLAGAMLTVVMLENGTVTALLVYVSVSLLSLFIVPDMDAKLLFIVFFGYYSIAKPVIEKKVGKPAQIILKFLIFNTSMLLGYYVSLKIMGMDETIAGNEILGKYAPAIFLLGVNFSFAIYDFLLTRYIFLYIYWFKPTFLRR